MENQTLISLAIEHWPFCAVAVVLAVLGRVADRIFTRDRAYTFDRKGRKVGKRLVWFWMRETLPAHPLAVGLLLGSVMPDPEGHNWARPMILLYYSGASVAGLACWLYLRAQGKAFPLPGESEPPPTDQP